MHLFSLNVKNNYFVVLMVKASPPQSTVSPSNQAIYTRITTAFVIILLQIMIIKVYSYNLLVKSFSIKEKINQNEKQGGILIFPQTIIIKFYS